MNITDAYKVLSLNESATPDEVKAKYKELVKTHHPDLGGLPVQFEAVQNAHRRVVEHMRAANCGECRGNGVIFRVKGFNSMKTKCRPCGGTGRRWG